MFHSTEKVPISNITNKKQTQTNLPLICIAAIGNVRVARSWFLTLIRFGVAFESRAVNDDIYFIELHLIPSPTHSNISKVKHIISIHPFQGTRKIQLVESVRIKKNQQLECLNEISHLIYLLIVPFLNEVLNDNINK